MTTMTKPTVTLDADHIYRVDGRIVPGYSEICADLGFPKNPYWTDAGREEGTALSQWLLFLAQGKESDAAPDPRIVGRVEGIRKFLREHEFKFVGGETPLYSRFGFCVTPDIWGVLDGVQSVIEAKRGAVMKRHRLQTAAQAIALAEYDFPAVNRFCLYLKDGGYVLEDHEDEEDFEAWRALVSAYHARGIYGK